MLKERGKDFLVNRLLSEHTAELNSLMGGGLAPPPSSLWIDKICLQVVEETHMLLKADS